MSTQQSFLVCDSSTLANFKSWAQTISSFFTTAGWTQSTDTGQVNWSTIASVPGSGAFIYEIWKPGDALTTFYLKVEYGNVSGTNCPSLRLSIGTSTNGSGTLTGYFTPPTSCNAGSFTPPSTTTTYECDFSGTTSRICVMMWRNAPGNQGQELFCVQRSLDNTGAETSSYVTLWTSGTATSYFVQQSIVFGVGLPTGITQGNYNPTGNNWIRGSSLRALNALEGGTTSAFNNGIPIDLAAPLVGPWGNECTCIGTAFGPDITEGVTFTATVYGVTKTYMPSKIGPWASVGLAAANTGGCILMEYD